MTFQIVPATSELVDRFFGGPPPFSFRGHVALLDSEPVGIGGISFVGEVPVAFTDMNDALRGRPADRLRCLHFLRREFKKWKAPLFAVCQSDEPTAPKVLALLGFVPAGPIGPGGQLMIREA